MPCSRSCGSQSVTVVPSWTSPQYRISPVRRSIRSVNVVFPASIWAMIPRFRNAVELIFSIPVAYVRPNGIGRM